METSKKQCTWKALKTRHGSACLNDQNKIPLKIPEWTMALKWKAVRIETGDSQSNYWYLSGTIGIQNTRMLHVICV